MQERLFRLAQGDADFRLSAVANYVVAIEGGFISSENEDLIVPQCKRIRMGD